MAPCPRPDPHRGDVKNLSMISSASAAAWSDRSNLSYPSRTVQIDGDRPRARPRATAFEHL